MKKFKKLSARLDEYLVGNWKIIDHKLGNIKTEITFDTEKNILSVYFGDIGDKYYRKPRLELTVSKICGGMEITGVVPTCRYQPYSTNELIYLLGYIILESEYEEPEIKKERSHHDIGKGEYEVFYNKTLGTSVHKFTGVCENFNPSGKCAFWNKEKEQMLVVDYIDILGLFPINNIGGINNV